MAKILGETLETPDFIAALKSERSSPQIAKEFGVHESTVRRRRGKAGIEAPKPEPKTEPGWEAGKSWDPQTGVLTDIRTPPMLDVGEDYQRVLDAMQITLPEGYVMRLVNLFYNQSAWTRDTEDQEKAVTRPTVRYHFKVIQLAVNVMLDIDPVGILAQLRAQSPLKHGGFTFDPAGDDAAFCLSINDVQLGQGYNGGSDATIAQFYKFVELARERIEALKRMGYNFTLLVVVLGGDLVEGCTIYANQSYNIDLSRKQQVEGCIALVMHAIDTLAPMFPKVQILASKGNHGEHRINGKKTTLDDNDDTHVAEMVKLGFARDPNMKHLSWTIAVEEAAVWMDVFKWTLATTHGDIYAKGVSGQTTERKAHSWMKNMAAAFRRFGRLAQADVLITHHFHHDEMSDWGDTYWRQTSSQDRGSPEFTQASGKYSEPGMLTWVMTPATRYTDEAVLRG